MAKKAAPKPSMAKREAAMDKKSGNKPSAAEKKLEARLTKAGKKA